MEKGLTELTDQELLEKRKKNKSNDITNAVIIGVFAGISIYSFITRGSGFFAFFPIVLIFLAVGKLKKDRDALKKELDSRNLK